MRIDLDELLKQDEAQLRAKKKRLTAFTSALEESRKATKKAAEAARAVIENRDLTRADMTRFFSLSKGERSDLLLSSTTRVVSSVTNPGTQSTNTNEAVANNFSQDPTESLESPSNEFQGNLQQT